MDTEGGTRHEQDAGTASPHSYRNVEASLVRLSALLWPLPCGDLAQEAAGCIWQACDKHFGVLVFVEASELVFEERLLMPYGDFSLKAAGCVVCATIALGTTASVESSSFFLDVGESIHGESGMKKWGKNVVLNVGVAASKTDDLPAVAN